MRKRSTTPATIRHLKLVLAAKTARDRAARLAPRCWQCKQPMVWMTLAQKLGTKPGRLADPPRWHCPGDCGPKALADLFRF